MLDDIKRLAPHPDAHALSEDGADAVADDVGQGALDQSGAFGDVRAVVLRFTIPPDLDAARADHALVFKVRRLSRNRAQRIIRFGDFRTPSGPLKPSSRLRAGDTVELWRLPPDAPDETATPPTVLYEDESLLVIDKPGDLVVHPSARYLHQTVTSFLRLRFAPKAPPHPCHRLDRETSGVLVCAHSNGAESAIKTAFANGGVEKTYLAVVSGQMTAKATIEHPLALQGQRGLVRIRMVRDADGMYARTDVEPLFVDEERGRTLVVCRPRTGRQHQIRAHLSIEGYPLVGDKLYAMGDVWFDAFTQRSTTEHGQAPADVEHPRHALHAYEAAFLLGGTRRMFRAPFPMELAALVPGVLETPVGRALLAGAPLEHELIDDDARPVDA